MNGNMDSFTERASTMYFHRFALIIALLTAVLFGGCSSHVVVPSEYSPDLAAARPTLNASVMIREVIDRRIMPGDMYFHDKDDMMHGRFDRPVKAIIKEALIYECERAGVRIVSPSMPGDSSTKVLECEIESFEMTCGRGPNKVPVLNTSVTLVFNWLDPETDAVIGVKRRSEEATTVRSWNPVFGKDELNMFSGEDKADLRAQSLKLVNELLPRAIQAELRQNEHLRKVAKAGPLVEHRQDTAEAEDAVQTAPQAGDSNTESDGVATEELKSAKHAEKMPEVDSAVAANTSSASTESAQLGEKSESATIVKPVSPTSTPVPFAITDPKFEAAYRGACNTDATITSVEGNSFEAGGQISIRNGALALWCYGAKHTWKGRLTYAEHVFDSDNESPLQFMVDKDEGYVYLGGKGTVTLPDGTVITLPVEHT